MQHERRNYWSFLLDGGFFVAGVSFVNAQTLLPGIILDEGGPAWLAAIVPCAMILGLFSLPVFISGWIDSLPQFKSHVLKYSVFQRLPYLVAALLLLIPGIGDRYLLWIIALTPFVSGLFGGLSFPAFQRMYMVCVPARLRASNSAFRYLAGGLAGVVAGWGIERLLNHFPLEQAMSFLHGIAFLGVAASWVALLFVREPSASEREGMETPSDLKTAPQLANPFAGIRDLFPKSPEGRNRVAFVVALVTMHTFFLSVPFFAAYLQRTVEAPVSFLGILAMWSMLGNAVGNLLAAWIGDRFGGRFTMAMGCFGVFLVLGVTPFVEGRTGVCAIYALFFLSVMLMVVGKDALLYDLGPQKRQAQYLALMALISLLALLGASATSYLIWELTGKFTLLAWGGALGSFAAFLAIGAIKEPRKDVRTVSLNSLKLGFQRIFR